eukprot:scaffold23786_cov129-Isochrysis_galbana.AAC.3
MAASKTGVVCGQCQWAARARATCTTCGARQKKFSCRAATASEAPPGPHMAQPRARARPGAA